MLYNSRPQLIISNRLQQSLNLLVPLHHCDMTLFHSPTPLINSLPLFLAMSMNYNKCESVVEDTNTRIERESSCNDFSGSS